MASLLDFGDCSAKFVGQVPRPDHLAGHVDTLGLIVLEEPVRVQTVIAVCCLFLHTMFRTPLIMHGSSRRVCIVLNARALAYWALHSAM